MNTKPSLFETLTAHKETIFQFLKQYLHKETNTFRHVNHWSNDIETRLLTFLQQGKMIRGSLLFYSTQLFGVTDSVESLPAAAAIELIHASLLIHDDIMDRDYQRRGKQTIFAQYETLAMEQNLSDSLHFGESMGICVGDYAIYLAYGLLSQMNKSSLTHRISREIAMVVLAQMQDIVNGYEVIEPSSEAILHLYTFKTGRYTFALPLLTAALLAEKPEFVEVLEKIGELLGKIFQIKDDELNLFGDEQVTGKPTGSDLRENKKTFHRLLLLENATIPERKEILKRLNSKQMNANDLSYLYDLLHTYQIKKVVQTKIAHMTQEVKTLINASLLPQSIKQILFELIVYNETRVK